MSACGLSTANTADPANPGDNPANSVNPGAIPVAAAFYPLEWLTQQVGGQDVAVTGLTKPGVEPHDLELTPQQVGQIEDARQVVYIKGVQPAVDEAVAAHAADRAFDAATLVPTINAASEEGEHEESDVPYDPHIWLDPSRFATIATDLGERLATADPAHAAGYKQRAAATAARLTALDGEYAKGLATCANRAIVTGHAAFGYLAQRYHLEQVGIAGIDPESEPSPARLAQVADVARQKQVTTIFTEELVSPKVAEVLAKEVGAATAVLNPIESRPEQGDYVSAARENLTTLRKALRCS
ncbi:zinc ABC transporter substrate-binding protein [Streptosporangiaceae bacterium NEAU-GS5]|nr:zinc ABC transporter substrate-binding protein [Streptosporangiaceae bacterium NEAU-GS5]